MGIICAIICLMCETETSKISASICLAITTIIIIIGGFNLFR